MTPDDDRMHPITLQYGSPKIFFMDTPEIMDHLVQCLEHLEWVGEARTGNTGSPDDIKKKDDHEFDALRYRIASKRRFTEKAPIRWKDRRRGRTVDIGYRGYD
ncbi:MAG: hypothetical protein GY722_14130 [bacterium]|nr:hypothetical protein [bacterium]